MRESGIRTLCTLGPASLNRSVIEKLSQRGVGCFRINMSHTSSHDLTKCIALIRGSSEVSICVDTEGAQVRTRTMLNDAYFRMGQRVSITAGRSSKDASTIPLRPKTAVSQLKLGSIVAVDFDSVLLLVTDVSDDGARAIVINSGTVKSNRAVTFHPHVDLPPLSERDHEAIKIGLANGVREYALSFANSAADVALLRSLVGDDSRIISKIESGNGIRDLDGILKASDAILIDRGDLSREVPPENIPFLQKRIIKKANAANRPVYVATNLLESMLKNREPTRAELNDVINTLIDGASGLVLAAETAIGEQPVAALDMLQTLIERYHISLEGYRTLDLLESSSLLLPKLHGSELSQPQERMAAPHTIGILHELHVIDIDEETAMDVRQIACDVYSPLTGFMNSSDLENVLDDYKLTDGTTWTLPIVFQISKRIANVVNAGHTVALRDPRGTISAVMHIEECFSPDMNDVARRWFGTDSHEHPGVKKLRSRGSFLLSGTVELVEPASNRYSPYSLTPAQSRMIFGAKGWTKVVAFHTRNVPHCGHEFLMREALSRTIADGLFMQPVIGPKKDGDFTASAIFGAYNVLIDEAFPSALLGAFETYSRYAGPREGVFTALCRKNFGCSHFIVGRDHTGVGSYYEPDATQKLFESLGDIGIEIVCFDKVAYCEKCAQVVEECVHAEDDLQAISGTAIRDALIQGKPVPQWLMRESISSFLRESIDAGEQVFV